MKPHPQGLGGGPADICKPLVWPFAANVLIFKEPQRQHLKTKPHSCRPASWAGGKAFIPLPLAPRRHIMWSGSIWKNSLQCCKLKGAALFLLTPAPLPEKNKRGHTGNPDYSKAKSHWSLGPKQEAELPMFAGRLISSRAQEQSALCNPEPVLAREVPRRGVDPDAPVCRRAAARRPQPGR